MNGGGLSSPQVSSHPSGGVSGRVAAVCPYIQVPAEGRQEAGYPAEPPPKPTPLSHVRSLSGWSLYFSQFLSALSFIFSNFLSVSSCLSAPFFSLPLSVVVGTPFNVIWWCHCWCCVTCPCGGDGCCDSSRMMSVLFGGLSLLLWPSSLAVGVQTRRGVASGRLPANGKCQI